MAATPPGARKRKLDYNIDQVTYDEFVKFCSKKGFAPNSEVERLMRKYVQSDGKI
jgi:hypothetical protein